MGWYVSTLVTFDAEGDEVPLIAGRMLSNDKREWSDEAKIVFGAVAEKRGYTLGPKGGVWAIAFTGNYTNGGRLAQELVPFFQTMCGSTRNGAMLNFRHGVVITQEEQNGSSRLSVIRFPGIVEEHIGPALWHDD